MISAKRLMMKKNGPPPSVALVPVLSSDASATATVGITQYGQYYTTYYAFRAFDGNATTQWIGSVAPKWIGFRFNTAKVVTSLHFEVTAGVAATSQSFATANIEYSDDGINWYVAKSISRVSGTTSLDFTTDHTLPHRWWRLNTLTMLGGNVASQCTVLQFYGY